MQSMQSDPRASVVTGEQIKIAVTEESGQGTTDSRPALSLLPPSSPRSFPTSVFRLSLGWFPSKVSKTMDTQRKSRQQTQPPLHLVSSPTTAQPISTRVQNHRQSESPFRYLNERLADEQAFNEKDQTPLADISSSSGRRASSTSRATHRSSPSTSRSSTPAPSHRRSHSKQQPGRHIRSTTLVLPPITMDNGRGRPPRRIAQLERSFRPTLSTRLQPWLPIILYAISSLGFVVAIAFWRTEIFQGMTSMCIFILSKPHPFLGLDDLSHHLQEEGTYGYCVIFLLIWVTTFRKCSMIHPTVSAFISTS